MKQCWIGILLALLLIFSLTACKDANNAAQPLPTAGSGGKLPEISKTETGDMNRDSSESSAVPDGKPDMIPPSDKEAAAVSVSGSGAEYPTSEQAFERLRETGIVRYYLELGMVMLDTGLQETVNGQNCRIISLGTDHETHFVQEIYYAVSCDTIYTYDQINDEWLELGSEPSIPGAEFAMSDLEGSWQMVEGEVEGGGGTVRRMRALSRRCALPASTTAIFQPRISLRILTEWMKMETRRMSGIWRSNSWMNCCTTAVPTRPGLFSYYVRRKGSRISLPSPILIRWNYTSLLKRTAIQGLLLLTTGGYETALMSKILGWQQKNISKAFL